MCLCGVAVCGVQASLQRSRRGGSEGTGVVSGRSDGSADTGVRAMTAMSVDVGGVLSVCMLCARCVRWERWE